jgi:hypothetical protein
VAGAGDRSPADSTAGPAAAAESTAGSGGLLSLTLTSTPDDPGVAGSFSAISPSAWLPPSRAEAAGLAACRRWEVNFFLPPLPLGSST